MQPASVAKSFATWLNERGGIIMSRIAKEAVIITKGVDCKIDNGVISMKGPKGELSLKLNPLVTSFHSCLTWKRW